MQDQLLVSENVEDYRKKLVQLKVPIQPFLICVGPLSKPECFFVQIADKKYKFSEPLLALEFLFKAYFSVHSKYPIHSESIWLFIQTALFNIRLQGDKLTSSVNILLGEIDAVFKDKSNEWNTVLS